jgi:hypothetical protein
VSEFAHQVGFRQSLDENIKYDFFRNIRMGFFINFFAAAGMGYLQEYLQERAKADNYEKYWKHRQVDELEHRVKTLETELANVKSKKQTP